MNQFKWRGTWGFGDAMMALNTAHNYSYTHDTPVELEMHWSHDEDYKLDARDTQTIVQQMKFIHAQYYQNDSCLLYTSPSPRDKRQSRMPSSA